ncbi:hypothetical protein [Phenylobacterium sp.]|uniref:hypothetical protein n=1 Tax=Phenylobacterium sp. TaxID=1871053 RepID=UPI002DE96FF0|nr:hypothetical protein [Phenylobacterium sp.]
MTTIVSEAARPHDRNMIGAVVLAGLAGGVVDFVYASVMFGLMRGKPIYKVWQGVAGGWLGKAAADGGYASAALGVVTHFAIALCMAGAYFLAATRLTALYRRPLLCGAVYGVALYAFMYGVVLPLRFGAPYGWHGLSSLGDLASHVGVGLAIAWVLSRQARVNR